MATKRHRFTTEFKARVAMEALRRGLHDFRRSRPSIKLCGASDQTLAGKPLQIGFFYPMTGGLLSGPLASAKLDRWIDFGKWYG